LSPETRSESYIIVDIDDVATRAVLVERREGTYSIKGKCQASTTLDLPILDVTEGVKRALKELGQKTGKELLVDDAHTSDHGFLCSSSTGGSLYMMVSGVIGMISGESAQRAALGAGALLIDVFSRDDPRPAFQMVERMRNMKPDMFLLAGGTDGGAIEQVLEMARLISAADIQPRFGSEYKLPVVFAGNVEVREEVSETLSKRKYATKAVENVRPLIETENLGPAKEAIYDSFMQHVIIHSPGYEKLVRWVDEPIIPTQAAIGKILYAYALERQLNLLAVDLGGATTDVYSVYNGIFNRSLNADIGLTYGICNVMKQTGIQNIMRWIPSNIGEREVRNIIGNLMILQPRSLSFEEMLVEQAAVREAIRMGVESHKNMASRLKGLSLKRTLGDIFNQFLEPTYLEMMNTPLVIGRGRVFMESKSRDAALLLLDGFQPEGVTEMLVDKASIMPHLGMLLRSKTEAALGILSKECLHMLGTCVAPKGRSGGHEEAMRIKMVKPDGSVIEDQVISGELKTVALAIGETARLEVVPGRGLDVGKGKGKRVEIQVAGGEIGLILDARGRPLETPADKDLTAKWKESLTPSQHIPVQAVGAD